MSVLLPSFVPRSYKNCQEVGSSSHNYLSMQLGLNAVCLLLLKNCKTTRN